MKFNLNIRTIILIAFFVILLLCFGLLYNYRYPQKESETNDKITHVNNYSRFFTLSNSANSYVNYLAKKKSDELYKLLDEDYKEKNNITKNNILSKLTLLDNDIYNFEARNIYQEQLSSHMIKYYIYGYLSEIIMDTYTKPTDYYLIIIMDTTNFTYSVIPDNGTLYKEVENE